MDIDLEMLIRRPPSEAWEAFADPERIRRFWLASATGRLDEGATVTWAFKIKGAVTEVTVLESAPGEVLRLQWDDGQPLTFRFAGHQDGCVVSVSLTGVPPEQAADASSGFTLVLASLKQWLEHGVAGDLMYDRFPGADYADR